MFAALAPGFAWIMTSPVQPNSGFLGLVECKLDLCLQMTVGDMEQN